MLAVMQKCHSCPHARQLIVHQITNVPVLFRNAVSKVRSSVRIGYVCSLQFTDHPSNTHTPLSQPIHLQKLKRSMELKQLRKSIGKRTFQMGYTPYPATYGAEEVLMTFNDFVDNISDFDSRYESTLDDDLETRELPLYAFLAEAYRGTREQMEKTAYRLGTLTKEMLYDLNMRVIQLFVGPTGSGAPPHYHGPALNFLAWGAKQWQLFPPATTRFSIKPKAAWNAEFETYNRSEVEMFDCLQREGDVLFIPRGWAHSTENLEFSTGVAVEFHSEILVSPIDVT